MIHDHSRWSSWTGGLLLGIVTTWAVHGLPYVNWQSAVAPVDSPLLIRHDAKGDGHFASPRSGRRRHQGVDVDAPLGSPVQAIRSGRVVEVGTHRGLGLFVEVEHDAALTSLYAHLKSADVQAGDRLRQGQRLGAVGKSGNARHPWIRPHLHLEVLHHDEPIDPATLGLAFIEPLTPAHAQYADAGLDE